MLPGGGCWIWPIQVMSKWVFVLGSENLCWWVGNGEFWENDLSIFCQYTKHSWGSVRYVEFGCVVRWRGGCDFRLEEGGEGGGSLMPWSHRGKLRQLRVVDFHATSRVNLFWIELTDRKLFSAHCLGVNLNKELVHLGKETVKSVQRRFIYGKLNATGLQEYMKSFPMVYIESSHKKCVG